MLPGLFFPLDLPIMGRFMLSVICNSHREPTMTSGPSTPPAKSVDISLPIEGMTCASCVGRVEAAIRKVPGVQQVAVNLATERADVQATAGTSLNALVQAIEKVGFDVPSNTIELSIEGMSCASCVSRVEAALRKVEGVQEVNVNLATEKASIRGVADTAALEAAVEAAGYDVRPMGATSAADMQESDARKDAEREQLMRDLLLAVALSLPVFVLEMGTHLVPGMHALIDRTIGMQASWLVQFLLTTLVLLFPGRRFYQKGLPLLMRMAPDMNSLVAVGTLAAYGYSVVATFAPGMLPDGTVNVYYEAAAVIVALILLGRFLEAQAKGRTSAAIRRLIGLQPRTARIKRSAGVQEVPLAEVIMGDVVEVRPGERVPVD